MKSITTLIFVFCTLVVFGQKPNQTTSEFTVTGQIRKELKFTLADLEKYPANALADVVITNHLGEQRGKATKLKGILMKTLLKEMEPETENPKLFSRFFLTFIAADNYRVVYSWNEIFNSPTGDRVYLITSCNGKEINDMEERILILTPTDFNTGRRYIKGLTKIVVQSVE